MIRCHIFSAGTYGPGGAGVVTRLPTTPSAATTSAMAMFEGIFDSVSPVILHLRAERTEAPT